MSVIFVNPSSPDPFSHSGEKGSDADSPLPRVGEGLGVRGDTRNAAWRRLEREGKIIVAIAFGALGLLAAVQAGIFFGLIPPGWMPF
jgi:hypothetical protein